MSSSWGGRRYPLYAFTEQGVAMLSSVLRSTRAVQVKVEFMRAFVRQNSGYQYTKHLFRIRFPRKSSGLGKLSL